MPVVLPDAHGRAAAALDRALCTTPARVEVGYAAQARQADDPKNTIVSVKRFMGRGVKDVAHIENSPYDFVDAPGMVQMRTVAGVKSPVEVSAEILRVLRERAELSLRRKHLPARSSPSRPTSTTRSARRPRTPAHSPA